jgi:hypothetical protein
VGCVLAQELEEVAGLTADGGVISVTALRGQNEELFVVNVGWEDGAAAQTRSWSHDTSQFIFVNFLAVQRDKISIRHQQYSISGGFEVVDEVEIFNLQMFSNFISIYSLPLGDIGHNDGVVNNGPGHAKDCHNWISL